MEKEGGSAVQIRISFRQKIVFLATLLPFKRTACVFSTTPELLAYVKRAIMLMEQQMSSTLCCK